MTDLARRIRDVARRAYETGGADGVSARKLGAALGVSQMAMYRHYRGKEDLLAAIVDAGFEELTARLREADGIRDPVRRLEARAAKWLEFALERPRLFDLMFQVPRAGVRRFPADFRAKRSPTGVLIEGDIAEAMAQGALAEDDPLEVGLALWAQMHGLIVLYLGGRVGLSEGRFKRLYRRSMKRLLLGIAR